MDRLNCGLVGSTPDGTMSFVNRHMLDWLGYREGELIGRPTGQLLPPEVQAHLAEERDAIGAGDIRMRLTMLQRKDSTTFPVLIVPQRVVDEQGEVVGSFSVLLDMGGVQTAKPMSYRTGDDVPERLDRIARELQAIGLAARTSTGGEPLPLEHPDLADLSPREREVLAHLVGGERVPAIAERLFLSQDTVRGHLKSIFRKVGVSSQSALLRHVQRLRG